MLSPCLLLAARNCVEPRDDTYHPKQSKTAATFRQRGEMSLASLFRCRKHRPVTPHAKVALAVDHLIASVICSCTAEGMVSPSAFAVLRLTTNSNSRGCSMGRSDGLAPLRICAVTEAMPRNMA